MIHIKSFSTGSMAVAVLLAAIFAITALYGVKDLRRFENATEQYLLCEKSAEKLQKGSDLLTEEVRLYSITGQREYMDGYFREANVSRSREEAVAELAHYFAGTTVMQELQQALQESKSLMETEYYAMRLTAAATGMLTDDLPEEVQSVRLTEADAALSDEEKLEKARALVFDSQYQNAKANIANDVDACMQDLTELTRQRQSEASKAFGSLYRKQEIGFALLTVCLIVISAVVYKSVAKPLVLFSESVQRDEPAQEIGAAELRTLAATYNHVLQEKRENQLAIRHQAEHDALSGLLNKGAFDKQLTALAQEGAPFALLLGDIDRFKFFNDTYGHAVGDAIIRSVAGHLQSTFRDTDLIYRAGGDEFAVILKNVSQKNRHTIEIRLAAMKKAIAVAADGLPIITMSIGVVFSDALEPEDSVFHCADQALYYVKNHGRDGHCVYEKRRQTGDTPRKNEYTS